MSAWDVSENSNFVVFVAQIDVCRKRPWVIGRAPTSLRVEGMFGEHVGTVGVRAGKVRAGVLWTCLKIQILLCF